MTSTVHKRVLTTFVLISGSLCGKGKPFVAEVASTETLKNDYSFYTRFFYKKVVIGKRYSAAQKVKKVQYWIF